LNLAMSFSPLEGLTHSFKQAYYFEGVPALGVKPRLPSVELLGNTLGNDRITDIKKPFESKTSGGVSTLVENMLKQTKALCRFCYQKAL